MNDSQTHDDSEVFMRRANTAGHALACRQAAERVRQWLDERGYFTDGLALVCGKGPLAGVPRVAIYYLSLSDVELGPDGWTLEFDVRPYEREVFPDLRQVVRVRLEWSGERLGFWRQTVLDTSRMTA
jgi:hypothetical protein